MDVLPEFKFEHDSREFERARNRQAVRFRLGTVPEMSSTLWSSMDGGIPTEVLNDENLPYNLQRNAISRGFLSKYNIMSMQRLLHMFVLDTTGLGIDTQSSGMLITYMRNIYVHFMRQIATPQYSTNLEVATWIHRLNGATLHYLVPEVAAEAERCVINLIDVYGERTMARIPTVILDESTAVVNPTLNSVGTHSVLLV